MSRVNCVDREPYRVMLNLPLYQQRFEPGSWRRDGFRSPGEAAYWSHRACGVACVRMVIAYFRNYAPDMSVLLHHGLALGAYSPRGWIHRGLAELMRQHRIPAEAIAVERSARKL